MVRALYRSTGRPQIRNGHTSPALDAPLGPGAFTLVELLVALGIIVVLIGVLIPALVAARRSANATRCTSNLRQIGLAVRLYANRYDGWVHQAMDGTTWVKTWAPPAGPSEPQLVSTMDLSSYWGVPYFPMLASRVLVEAKGDAAGEIVTFARGIWLCPSSGGISNAGGNTDVTNPVSYGINGRITGATLPRFRKLTGYRSPAEVILAQDAVESRMEDRQGDMLSDYGTGSNLTHWRPPLGVGYVNGQHRDAAAEYYRHRRQCNVLWADGHVSALSESLGKDVPSRWYEAK